jgi:hypothetical protein
MPNISRARGAGGAGANMLMLGKYVFDRGVHKLGKPSGHRAFRQATFFPIWRTLDDLDYDAADQVDLGATGASFFWDNLHCAYHDNLQTPGFSSAGCQVVCGHPMSATRGNKPETGPWKAFIESAYGGTQQRFTYLLFSGFEAIGAARTGPLSQSVRFGSEGALVKAVQKKLIAAGYPLPTADGTFGRDTLEALMAFQVKAFGPSSADGVVGQNTASALDVQLPPL